MNVDFSSHFLKRAKRLSHNDKVRLSEKTEIFRNNTNDPRLKLHALSGELKGYFSFSLTHGKRVKLRFDDKETVLFVDVGSHDEVYR